MTTKFLKYSVFLPIICLLLTACEEQVVNKFDDAPSLFFYRGENNAKGSIQRDSVNYSFFLAGSRTVDTVWVDVRLTGSLSPQERPLPIVQTNAGEENAAVAGRDYEAFDTPAAMAAMVMPANSIFAAVPIIVKRTDLMNSTEYRLDLAITSNEYFVAGFDGRQAYTIKITAMASQPAMWENTTSNGYFQTFGAWGQEKMRFIIDYVGYADFDQTLTGTTYTDIRRFYNMKARRALTDYLLTHDPLFEADGTEVVFPLL
ncbi:MAG: DUF4843 domain-containing protein [Dysgonamonadaceae bacterium]|jgi:hypothetical protein|nr:DUF4843 domain-containing protein [Dysgonamonadaceae bacterium]